MDLILKVRDTVVYYWRFLGLLVLILIFGFASFSYIQAELNTKLYTKDISNIDELCNVNENADFKYIKIISYEKALNSATIYCLYQNSSKNIQLEMTYRQTKWRPYLTTLLNKERNFYWPTYV